MSEKLLKAAKVSGFLALGACLALVASPGPAPAAPIVSCHCFKDRDYDPADPGKTDVYLLATTANTFLAAAYGFPKAEVVRSRMSGVSGEDLWIAAYAADRLGLRREELLLRRKSAGSWPAVFTALGAALEPLGPVFVAALAGKGGDESLARVVVARTLEGRLGADRKDLDELTKRGATIQEMVLAICLGRWSRRPAAKIYAEVKTGAVTWSGLLKRLGRVPSQMESEIPRELGPTGARP